MELEQYMNDAARTVAPGFDATRVHPDLLHSVMGMVTEAAELMDGLKKVCAYNKPLDVVNLDEEVGDMMWYIALYCHLRSNMTNDDHSNFVDARDILENIMDINIAKLRARFPEKYSDDKAQNRDLAAERTILEGGAA